ncbi:MAG: InlB B-repeat-containing protein [Oscillospiraceae bacterium]|nr:InlB B-repeat-containing protein [Oscillospiraceae bacterium]
MKIKKLITLLTVLAVVLALTPAVPLSVQAVDSWSGIYNPVIDASTHADGTQPHITEYSYVYFGTYPQSQVSGETLTSDIIGADYDSNGDAVVNGVKYRRLSKDMATEVKETNGYFSWGRETYYYFKYESIKWRVLEIADGFALMAAENVLDTQKFRAAGGTSEKWETSTIRAWLNADSGYSAKGENFINTAFNSRQTSYIQATYLENKTNPEWKISSGSDTRDKIFLLSYDELGTEKYGHCLNQASGTCTQHRRIGTDYAWAMGVQKDPQGREAYKDMVGYLGRTGGELFGNVTGVDFTGRVSGTAYVITGHGVLPALNIACNADNLHKVTFDSAGETFIPAYYAVEGTPIPKPNDPTKAGYILSGWYKEAALTDEWDFDTDAVTADITLYAKWTCEHIPSDENCTVCGVCGDAELSQTCTDGNPCTLHTPSHSDPELCPDCGEDPCVCPDPDNPNPDPNNPDSGNGGGGSNNRPSNSGRRPITTTTTTSGENESAVGTEEIIIDVPKAVIEEIAGNLPVTQIAATSAGSQTITTAASNAGQNAVLMRYNAETGEFEVVSAATVGADGTATVNIPAAGDYIVVVAQTGDLTGTGAVTPADALLLLQALTGNAELNPLQKFLSSSRGDSKFTATDALNILKFIAGMLDEI